MLNAREQASGAHTSQPAFSAHHRIQDCKDFTQINGELNTGVRALVKHIRPVCAIGEGRSQDDIWRGIEESIHDLCQKWARVVGIQVQPEEGRRMGMERCQDFLRVRDNRCQYIMFR